MAKKSDDQFSKKEAARRFEAALKGARLVNLDKKKRSLKAQKTK
jgi:hypothetical protein